jgi:hypothetical protein
MVQSLMACLSIAVVLLLGVAITTENGKEIIKYGSSGNIIESNPSNGVYHIRLCQV